MPSLVLFENSRIQHSVKKTQTNYKHGLLFPLERLNTSV